MKNIGFTLRAVLVVIALIVCTATAYAITTATAKPGQAQYTEGTVMQNNTATAPAAQYTRTGSTAVNKGRTILTFNAYTSSSWFKKADVCVTNSSGVGQPVRYQLGSNSTMIAPSGCFGVTFNRGYAAVTVTPFSNTSSATQTTYYWSHQRE